MYMYGDIYTTDNEMHIYVSDYNFFNEFSQPPPKQPRRLFTEDGRPLNVNEAK